jgi:hypothetical protein
MVKKVAATTSQMTTHGTDLPNRGTVEKIILVNTFRKGATFSLMVSSILAKHKIGSNNKAIAVKIRLFINLNSQVNI